MQQAGKTIVISIYWCHQLLQLKVWLSFSGFAVMYLGRKVGRLVVKFCSALGRGILNSKT